VTTTAPLPAEGRIPELDGATAWLNSTPLTRAGLRGKVVVGAQAYVFTFG
jgi:hypothetical protein